MISAALFGSPKAPASSEEFECAAELELFGDLKAEGACLDAGWDFRGETDHSLAVRGKDLGVDVPGGKDLPVTGGSAVDADGDGTAATESVEDGALSFDGEAGLGVVERGDGGADVVVVGGLGEDGVGGGAGFEGERSLSGCGT